MALQDLTPQLRTRLSRMERAVGLFVILAAGLLLFGFGYYIYNTAERKGWFKTKAPYFTFTDRATGLKLGDPVKLMGLDVGQITRMDPQPPEDFQYNMYVEFEIKDPYYGYLWTEGSKARVATADLLGKRVLEVTKGTGGHPTYVFNPLRDVPLAQVQSLPDWQKWKFAEDIYDNTGTNLMIYALSWLTPTNVGLAATLGRKEIRVLDCRAGQDRKRMTGVWMDQEGRYQTYEKSISKPYWLKSEESAAVTERLEALVGEVEKALPNILSLTNQLLTVLSNGSSLTSNLNTLAINALPVVSNIVAATAGLDRPGALGEWLLPTNLNRQLVSTLANADTTLTNANSIIANANSNVTYLADNLTRSLNNLADITSNLNSQVQVNTNIVGQLSETIVHADEFVQGLKRHWLLRSAFKSKATNAPSRSRSQDVRSPKEKTK